MVISNYRRFSLDSLFEDITDTSNQCNENKGLIETFLSKNENEMTSLITMRHPLLCTTLRIIRQLDGDEDARYQRSCIDETFLACVMKVSGSSQAGYIWLKENLDEYVAYCIMGNLEHSQGRFSQIKEVFLKKTLSLRTKWCSRSTQRRITNFGTSFILNANCYLDLVMDTALLFIVMRVKGLTGLVLFDSFTSQIVLLLFISIAIPHIMSAVETAYKMPLHALWFLRVPDTKPVLKI